MFYGHAKFTSGNSQNESRYSPSPVYRCRVWWIQNWLQFQQHFSDSVSSIFSVKDSPVNAIKISAAILQTVNLLSFSLFDRCDSDKPEKINILLLSGFCLWTLHDHKTLGDKNWDELTKPFFKKKHSRGLSSRDTRVTRQGPSSLRHPAGAVLFAFVCSVVAFSTPEPTILLACGRNRELWEQPFQACAIDADAQWAG